MINSKSIKEDLLIVRKTIDKIPSKNDYRKNGSYGVNTVVRCYGSWNNALMETFGETYQTSPKKNIQKECSNCRKPIEINASTEKEHNFCSQSCAASFNNQKRIRKREMHTCASCDKTISKKRTYCNKCMEIGKHLRGGKNFEEKTIQEVINESTKLASKFSAIRDHARRIVKSAGIPLVCAHCSYSTSVQVCHVIDIADFPLDTKIKIVNDLSNLLVLCRNHHWEFDHGYLEKDEIGRP